MRTDEQLEWLLVNLRAIAHGNVIRRHSRVFSTLPQRISPRLTANLAPFGPLYSNTHFNHAAKITPQGENACRLLAKAGIPMGCQAVLLRGLTILQPSCKT